MIVVTGSGLLLAERDGIADADPRVFASPPGVRDRTAWLAETATTAAWADAGFGVHGEGAPSPERTGCTITSSKLGLGGLLAGLDEAGGDPLRIPSDAWRAFIAPALSPPRARGPVVTAIGACATGLASWIRAAALLENDEADVVLAGSAEGTTHPLTVGGFRRMGVVSRTRPRPFDRRRDGFVPAEGAGVAVLEREADAASRGAVARARLLGWAQAGETGHAVATPPDGASIIRLIARALSASNLDPASIDYVHLHGTGTRNNDRAEAAALRATWDARGLRVPASSTKGRTGHCLGAAGAVETLLTIEELARGRAPGTWGLEEPDPECASDCLIAGDEVLVPGRPLRALVLSYGFGGTMAAIVLEVPRSAAAETPEWRLSETKEQVG